MVAGADWIVDGSEWVLNFHVRNVKLFIVANRFFDFHLMLFLREVYYSVADQ